MKLETKKNDKYTASRMELAISDYFGVRQNVVVPNVSWGLPGLNHEADLLVLRDSGWAEEIEIKVSASDIVKDKSKHNGMGHVSSCLIHKLWFAVPMHLSSHIDIPDRAGILGVVYDMIRGKDVVVCVRGPKITPGSRKLKQVEILKVLRLSNMRVWSLKRKLYKFNKDKHV